MKAVTTTPATTLSAPSGRCVIAVIGADGCAAVLDDAAPPVALSAGTVLIVSPEHALGLIWGRTCGWTAWSVDVSLVRRAQRRAGLGHLAGLRVAAVWDHAAVRSFETALAAESLGAGRRRQPRRYQPPPALSGTYRQSA